MEENPYQSPESIEPSEPAPLKPPPKGGAVKYIVATFGAVFVFIGTLPGVMILGGLLGYLWPEPYRDDRVVLVVLSGIALLLAVLAAGHSFRATLRTYARTKD